MVYREHELPDPPLRKCVLTGEKQPGRFRFVRIPGLDMTAVTVENGTSYHVTFDVLPLRNDIADYVEQGRMWLDDNYYLHVEPGLRAETISGKSEGTYGIYHGRRVNFGNQGVIESHHSRLALAEFRQRALPYVSGPTVLREGRKFAFMPGSENDRCPQCRKRYSLRSVSWGLQPVMYPEDRSVLADGCAVGPGPMASFQCKSCIAKFDENGEPIARSHEFY